MGVVLSSLRRKQHPSTEPCWGAAAGVCTGVNPASISCLAFSSCASLLAVCSSTGTLHLYNIATAKGGVADADAAAARSPASAAEGGVATTNISSSASATRKTESSSTTYMAETPLPSGKRPSPSRQPNNPKGATAPSAAAEGFLPSSSPASSAQQRLATTPPSAATANVKSSWTLLGKLSPYFNSEWSLAQFKSAAFQVDPPHAAALSPPANHERSTTESLVAVLRFHFTENFSCVCAFGQEPNTLLGRHLFCMSELLSSIRFYAQASWVRL